ncbi:CofH family radical SAM protein [Chrysiogenes arsenatis]|uniref:CofH family radical SAM protein n=1 Tax=Chrysiogenes arsenatis TaxID=309797 RepID=UPI000421EB18|nr:CofH family radical SAM protein [Chrysiogenes arsenatis]
MQKIYDKIDAGERITPEEGIALLEQGDLLTLGALAHQRRLAAASPEHVTYVIDRNINYTNICECKCSFCAFYTDLDAPNAYWLDRETFRQKIRETIAAGGNQILLQGGLHPDKGIEAYEAMLRGMKEDFPALHIHGFGAPEVDHIAKVSQLSLEATLLRLKAAGLGTIPGGGAEVLVNHFRSAISPNKISADRWIAVMEAAHHAGIRTTATMMFGAGESNADLIEHFERLRLSQQATGGYTAFIPWPFQPDNTEFSRQRGGAFIKKTSHEYLRLLAVSRIYLDNFKNIQASWVTLWKKISRDF